MLKKITMTLSKRLKESRNKVFPYVDLNMKNGDEITVYAPDKWIYGSKDYAILTDDNKVIHFETLESVANWIIKTYC